MANYETPPFPRAVTQGKAITEYDKNPKWTLQQVNSYLWEAVKDIQGWLNPEYHFQADGVLNQLDNSNPSFSVVFRTEHSNELVKLAERYGLIFDELDINHVLREAFARGYNVSYSKLATGRHSTHINVPSNPLGHFGWADETPGAKDLKYLSSHYVTGSQIHPFYLYSKESPDWIIGQDPHRLQANVKLQTAEQFLNHYQPQRRDFWIAKNRTLSEAEMALMVRLESIDNERAQYDLDKLDGIEMGERQLLPRPKVSSQTPA